MTYARRLLWASVPAALANFVLMIVWVEAGFGWTDLGKLLGRPLLPFLVTFGLVYLVTAFGLSLLILLTSPLLVRPIPRGLAAGLFIVAGGLLGGAIFAWTPAPLPLSFAACGTISAAFAAWLMPDLFGAPHGILAQDALAD